MKPLEGGRAGQIWGDGETVTRPSGAWTPTVHRFLRHLRSSGFLRAPQPVEIAANGREIVSYVAGRVCDDLGDPLTGSESMLISAARLLRDFHAASQGFLESDREPQRWMLPSQEPREIVCHGDLRPTTSPRLMTRRSGSSISIQPIPHRAYGILPMRSIAGRPCPILPIHW